MLSLSSTSALLKFLGLIDEGAIYQTEAFEQTTIPDADTLPFLANQACRSANESNQSKTKANKSND